MDLNQGLAPGTLNGAAKQVLAPNALLAQAAETHSDWMLATDTFGHAGAGGSSAGDRIEDAGYNLFRRLDLGREPGLVRDDGHRPISPPPPSPMTRACS